MEQLTPISIVALFETNKAQRASFVDQLVNEVKEGNVNPLNIHLQIKCMEDIVKQLTGNKEYQDALLEEAGKHGKSFEYHSAKIEIKEVGVKYDFSQCDDVKLAEYNNSLNEWKEKVKDRESFLRTAPSKGTVITDEESGETYTIYPPSKSSTTSVTVSLK